MLSACVDTRRIDLMPMKKSLMPASVAIIAGVAALCSGAAIAADQNSLVANTAIDGPVLRFDWPAIEVGVGSYEEGPTGVTVIRFPKRASLAVDVRGGGPGTVNTDLLRLGYSRPFGDAIVFSGGSAYGEEAITAVATGLKDDGVRSGDFLDVAIVPGAIIYDFGARRLNEIYPDKRLAQAALRAVRPGVFPLGAQGAGRMAMQGGFFGCNAHSGQGGAFRQVGAVKIAAFTVVNAYGAVTDRAGRLVACNKPKSWGNLTMTSELLRSLPQSLKADWDAAAASPDAGGTKNTTISLIVTNQKLDYATLQRLAVQVHTSMARAIQPFSTENDGDTLYAASTQEIDSKEFNSLTLTTIASEAMWDAVLASVPDNAVSPTPAEKPASVSADKLAAYAGTYEFGSAAAGGFGGLGLHVRIEDGQVKVVPIAGLAGARAGILADDKVTRLDGAPLNGLPINSVLSRMRGPPGSKTVLTIVHNGGDQPVEVPVIREMVSQRVQLRVKPESGSLFVEVIGRRLFGFAGSALTPLTPLSDTEFYADGRSATRIAFTVDAAGKVSGAVLNPGRWEQKGVKID